MPGLTLLIHLYYPGSWPLLEDRCRSVLRKADTIIITACHDDVLDEVRPPKKDSAVIRLKVPNKGKDIGGKLAAFSYYMRFCEKTGYIALLHDKVSPQTINADYWSQQLYSLYSKEGLHKALQLLEQDPHIGIVGAKTFLKNEYMPSERTFATTNHQLLMEMIRDYRLHGRIFDFIAGTIFIARSCIFEQFFSTHSALDARARLETGNVLDLAAGTYTHSWERLFCFLAEDQGLSIKGI